MSIPALGAFVWPDHVALDYRMGSGWDARSLGAFARLLGELRQLVPHARIIAIPDGGSEQNADRRFDPALETFLSSIGNS
ncbi:MAG: hypothetical protein M3N47_13430 [Chloroflexota bacterium]|nr:hypothetical protein [Chloroflexota bacterium]